MNNRVFLLLRAAATFSSCLSGILMWKVLNLFVVDYDVLLGWLLACELLRVLLLLFFILPSFHLALPLDSFLKLLQR